MLQINPKIMQIKDFDENCLWMICKMIDIMKKYKVNRFKNSTLQKYTGWGKNKVIQTTDKLEELKIISKNETTRNFGGRGANSYKILTGFIGWVENLQDQEFEITDDEKDDKLPVSQNQTPIENDICGVLKSNTAVSQNQTPIKQLLPISLNTYLPTAEASQETSLLETFLNFELGEELSTIIQMNHKLSKPEIAELVFIFKSETKYLERPPSNLHKTFLNWVQIAKTQKAEMNSKLKEIELKSNQRIETENELQTKIAQTKLAKYQTASASNPAPTYSKPYSKPYQKPYQSNNYNVIEVDPSNFETEEEMRLFMLNLDEENKIYRTLRPSTTRERIWAENKSKVKDVKNIPNCPQIEIVQTVELNEKVFEITPNLEIEKIEKTAEQKREENRQVILEGMRRKNPKLAKNFENEIELKSNQRIETENELQTKIAQTKLAKYQTASASNPAPTYSKPYLLNNYNAIEVDPNDFETEKEMRLFMLNLEGERKFYKTLRPTATREQIWAENESKVKDVKNIPNCPQIEIVQAVGLNEKVFEITPNLEIEKIAEQKREENRQAMLEAMRRKNPKLAKNFENSQSPYLSIARKLLAN